VFQIRIEVGLQMIPIAEYLRPVGGEVLHMPATVDRVPAMLAFLWLDPTSEWGKRLDVETLESCD
jgi:hypothetical protein